LEETTMKKLMTVGSALVLALAIGCKKEEPPAAAPVEPAKPVEAAKPADPAPEATKPADPAAEAAKVASSGIPECDEYLATAEKFAKCDKLAPEAKDAQAKSVEATKASWAALTDDASKKVAADSCKQLNETMAKAWTAAGCM
jgi:hypothetical protein